MAKFANKGFTLIETVVYVAVLGTLVVALSNLTLSTLKNYRLVKVRENLAASADAVFRSFLQETKNADEIYTPTTVFGSDNGELSLKSFFQPTDNTEPETYVDIYLAGGQVWFKRENQTVQALTAENLEVTRFRLIKAKPGDFGGVRMYLDIKSRDWPNEKISLITFAMVKGIYTE